MEQTLRRLHWFLNFYYAPWGAVKTLIWEHLSNNKRYSAPVAYAIATLILDRDPNVCARIDKYLEKEDACT